MRREIEDKLMDWRNRGAKKALLVEGARQIGKTYSIRRFGGEHYSQVVEINFLENEEARTLFETARSAKEMILYFSLFSEGDMSDGDTLIFLDEVQECAKILTAIKFLVEDGRFDYILSGSLLGVEMKNIRSVPVGYMEILSMHPINFREFASESGVKREVFDEVEECFRKRVPVPELIHSRLMDIYRLYLVVGGMPEAVRTYLETSDMGRVIQVQKYIVSLNKADITKYDRNHKLFIEDIYDRIPAELAAQNKRFEANSIKYGIKFDRVENGFLWLTSAGVANAVYCANEVSYPLMLSRARNQLKLFMGDVGLLTAMYAGNMQIRLLRGDVDINYGGIYENAVCEELAANEMTAYYYRNNRIGEIDFVCEIDARAIPIEVKSGKNYKKHSALNHLLNETELQIPYAYILSNQNIETDGKKVYLPVYMAMYLKNSEVLYRKSSGK